MTALSLALLGVLLYPLAGAIGWEERVALGWLFEWRGAREAPRQVAVVAIDEATYQDLNLPHQLPDWPRAIHAQLVDRLTLLGVRTIAFDIYFRAASKEGDDGAFADAIKRSRRVILFAHSHREVQDMDDGHQLYIDRLDNPVTPLAESAVMTAPFVLPKWPNQVSRFWTHSEALGHRLTLPAAALNLWWKGQGFDMQVPPPTERLFNFYGPPRTITVIPYQHIIQGRSLPVDLKGRAVFVGYVARHQPEQRDSFYTVYSQRDGVDLTGVELAATIFGNLLEQSDLKTPPLWVWLGIVAIYGVLVTWLSRLAWTGVAVLAPILLALLYGVLVYRLFVDAYWWLPLLVPVCVQTPIALVWNGFVRSRSLRQQRDRIRSAFGLYLPESEVKRLARQPALGPAQKRLSGVCLATDAENYTSLSERLDPEELAQVMSRYYEAVFGPVRQYGGLISDVAGDGIIALWPVTEFNEALFLKVCEAAVAIKVAVERFNRDNPDTPLPTRIGLHAGTIVLGHLGALDHYEYRAVGDIVNTTCRIQGLNKQVGSWILASDACLPEPLLPKVRDLGEFVLSGKRDAVRLYELGVSSLEPAHLEAFHDALKKLREGDVNAAKQAFDTLQKLYPDDAPGAFFCQQCQLSLEGGENLTKSGAIRIRSK